MLKDAYSFNDLVEIMKFLRSGKGCPWDREQSYKDLKKYLIEETYEVLEAIDLEDSGKLSEELGRSASSDCFFVPDSNRRRQI